MPNVMPPTNTPQALRERIALAEQSSVVDFNFYTCFRPRQPGPGAEFAKGAKLVPKPFCRRLQPVKEAEFKGMTAKDDGELYCLITGSPI
jgi:hypothetical protein